MAAIFTKTLLSGLKVEISLTDISGKPSLMATLNGEYVYGSNLVALPKPVVAANGPLITHVLGGPSKSRPNNPTLAFTAEEAAAISAAKLSARTETVAEQREKLVQAYRGASAAAEANASRANGSEDFSYDPAADATAVAEALKALRVFDATH